MDKIIIFGATSALAVEAARCFTKDEASMLLVARSEEKLKAVRNDLLTRGAKEVFTYATDLAQMEGHERVIARISKIIPEFNIVLVAYGTLGDQKSCERDYSEAEKEFRTNFLSVVSLLTPLANTFEAKGCGTIAVITSVAGDRGRQSNYIYGVSKGALSLFLQGLRNRLAKSGVAVVDLRPGSTKTPMTADMKQGLLFSEAQVVGTGIYKAIKDKKDIVYLPWYWRYIMLIIKSIPESIFKKLSL